MVLKRLALAATLATLLGGAQRAHGQDWIEGSVSRAVAKEETSATTIGRLEAGTSKLGIPLNYAFIDLSKEGYFGQAQFSQPIGKGITLGAEYEANSWGDDAAYPQVGFNGDLGKFHYEIRAAPVRIIGPQQQQASVFVSTPQLHTPLGTYEASTWADATRAEGRISGLGELEIRRDLGSGWKANAIIPWSVTGDGATAQLYAGIKKAL